MSDNDTTWQGQLDTMTAAMAKLGDVKVDDSDVEAAVKYAAKLDRQLFYWRRTVEAHYLDRLGSVPNMVAAVAMQDDVPPVRVLADLCLAGALMPVWWKLEKYMTEHGVDLYPELDKEASDGNDG